MRLYCQRPGCRKWVDKDEEKQTGWMVIFTYPLNGNGQQRRLLLCRACFRFLERQFK